MLSDGVLLTARSLALDVAGAQALNAFASSGVDAILLKGQSFAEWLYADGSPRYYVDVDLIIPRDGLDKAKACLRELGYRESGLHQIPHDRPWHSSLWLRSEDQSKLELHTTLVGVGATEHRLWDELMRHTSDFSLAGVSCKVLDVAGRAFHVAIHAGQHGPMSSKSMEDLRRALEVVPHEEWETAADIAAAVDAIDAFIAGLSLLPKGIAVAERLGLSYNPSAEVLLRARGSNPSALAIDWIRRTPSVVGKAKVVARKLFPPREFIRDWDERARKGPLSLRVAYVRRWIWVVRQVPPATVAWRKARKESRG